MKCPHCLVEFHDVVEEMIIGDDIEGRWSVVKRTCPSCKKLIVELVFKKLYRKASGQLAISDKPTSSYLVRPKTPNRMPVPPEVPKEFASDYLEACLVISDSAKASAALSRRCLQHILREKAGVKSDLAREIQQVIDNGTLPSHLSDSLDAIRNIGNFASHPIKSSSTGELVDVEPGEAEWNLDVIESLFDFFFVQPEIIKRKRDFLNQKLVDAGKPPMK